MQDVYVHSYLNESHTRTKHCATRLQLDFRLKKQNHLSIMITPFASALANGICTNGSNMRDDGTFQFLRPIHALFLFRAQGVCVHRRCLMLMLCLSYVSVHLLRLLLTLCISLNWLALSRSVVCSPCTVKVWIMPLPIGPDCQRC